MAVVKSDAMLLHEKWIAYVMEHNPKRGKEYNPLPEVKDMIIVVAVIVVIAAAVLSIMH
ncbi:MAG: hypothetical protein WB392_13690 [Methanotrichaceae archaeon]